MPTMTGWRNFKKMKELPPLPLQPKIRDRSLPAPPIDAYPDTPPPVPSKKPTVTILSLPNEMLECIFSLAVCTSFPVEDPNYPHPPLFSKTTPISEQSKPIYHASHLLPSVLSQTCHRFRILLLHTPHLWSYIHITRVAPPRGSPKSSWYLPPGQSPIQSGSGSGGLDKHLGWLPVYLVRAHPALLHVVLDTTKYPLPIAISEMGSSTSLNHPFSYVLGTSKRWSSLTILTSHLGSASLAPTLDSLAHTAVPNLASLRVAADIWREGIVSYDTLPAFFLEGAPKLRHVQMDGAYIGWDQDPLMCSSKSALVKGGMPEVSKILPTNNLRALELNFATLYPVFSGLQRLFEKGCPNLEKLVIHDDIASILRCIRPPSLAYFDNALEVADHRDYRHTHSSSTPSSTPTSMISSGSTDYPPQLHHQASVASLSTSPTTPAAGAVQDSQPNPESSSPSPSSSRFPSGFLHPLSGLTSRLRRDRSDSAASTTSTIDSSSSPSLSAPASPTTPSSQIGKEGSPHRDFRKIALRKLKHLEIKPYRSHNSSKTQLDDDDRHVPASTTSLPVASPSELGQSGSGESSSTSTRTVATSSIPARLLYLFSTPCLETLVLSQWRVEEWMVVADMLGLPANPADFVPRELAIPESESVSGEHGHGDGVKHRIDPDRARTYPFLRTLDVNLALGR